MSEIARLSGVFFDPKPAFADVAARPRWWVPMLLITLAAILYTGLYSQRVGWDRFMRQTMESNPRVQQMPADQRERVIQMQTRMAGTLAYAGAAIFPTVAALATAGVLLLIFNMMGGELKFRTVFGVTCYASLTGLVATALAILVMFLKNPDDFDLKNPTAFNVGAYLDPQTAPKWLVSAGTSLDLFSIWTILLLAAGLSVAARKISFGKALAGIALPWLFIWIPVKSFFAALFS